MVNGQRSEEAVLLSREQGQALDRERNTFIVREQKEEGYSWCTAGNERQTWRGRR